MFQENIKEKTNKKKNLWNVVMVSKWMKKWKPADAESNECKREESFLGIIDKSCISLTEATAKGKWPTSRKIQNMKEIIAENE